MKKQSFLYYLNISLLYFLLAIIFGYPIVQKINASQNTPQFLEQEFLTGKPDRLVIPRLDIGLAVIEGMYNLQSWNLAENMALYAANTTQPNNRMGNTVIYGHNTPAVFYPTRSLQTGDRVFVYTDNKLAFEYIYSGDEYVLPYETFVFNTDNQRPRLTLLTCNGFLNDHRRLMYFNFVKVTKLP